ncbi:MAG: hypothetical protein KatS3mg122_2840 [Caldimonas sp.]|uniref:hypothetical protein n=1 Tax=Caldimonas taiwanensis TaxID=307483 RepID=UPI000785D801|nr:hypothetical protein [Caldimonas taiwanensis]GIX25609.1 MAG: hypothetical protein KatS3mg122_2840 [Caldimonas sp.]
MYFLVTVGMVALGIWMFTSAVRIRKELARYEFEHRDAGGNVTFKSFEDAERHRKREARMNVLVTFGVLLVLVGGLGLLAGITLPRFLV